MPGIWLAVTPEHQLVCTHPTSDQLKNDTRLYSTHFRVPEHCRKPTPHTCLPDILYPTTIPAVEMASADEDDLLRCFEKAFQGFDDKISPSSPECQQDNDASPESLCSTKCSSGHASVSKRELTPPILPVTSLRTGDMYTSQLGYGMGYQVPSPIKDAQDQEKAFEDSYFGHYNAASMQLFVPDLCDEALSSAPSTSEPSFGGISRRNSSEEPTSPATSDYQLPSRSQCIFTPSPNINNTNSNTSDIQTLDSTFMPALMPVPVSVLPSPSQPTIQRMQPNTFMPFMSSMSTMSTMPPMPNMQTMTYNGTTPLTSALDSPPTDFIDTLFSSCPLEHPAPVPLFTQNCEDMLFDLDDFTVWNANLVPTLAPQLPPQSPEELYAIPTQERVTAQLETYFRRPDQQRLRRTLESIQ
ncbi:hypothetical protein CPB86DRAFT_819258, partial [Serendipita vermifera]